MVDTLSDMFRVFPRLDPGLVDDNSACNSFCVIGGARVKRRLIQFKWDVANVVRASESTNEIYRIRIKPRPICHMWLAFVPWHPVHSIRMALEITGCNFVFVWGVCDILENCYGTDERYPRLPCGWIGRIDR